MRGPQRHDVFVAGAAALFLCAHLALLRPQVEDIDSINFALAASDFDLSRHQPHPPGYPVFVLAVRLAAAALQPIAGVGFDAALLGLVLLSAGGGTAAILLAHRVWLAIGLHPSHATNATVLFAVAPLVWIQAARPLSDMPGLAAALAAQLLLVRSLRDSSRPAAAGMAGLVTGVVVGVRSQIAWLTLPALLVSTLVRIQRREWQAACTAIGGTAVGALAWFVPLIVLSGGWQGYVGVLGRQAGEDFAGVRMVATHPEVRVLLGALHDTFATPWGSPWLAVVTIASAVAGVGWLARRERPALLWMAVLWLPYAVLHLLFQETETTRYALPLMPVVCALAAVGHATLPSRALRRGVAVAVVTASVALSAVAAWQYRAQPPELFMRAPHLVAEAGSDAPAAWLMHRRVLAETTRVRQVAPPQPVPILAGPTTREWQEAIPLWLGGETRAVWWLVDPTRGDRVAIDPGSQHRRAHVGWPLPVAALLGGLRPHAFDWYAVTTPSWMLGEGWALTPELAGLAHAQQAGPSTTGAHAHVRRTDGPLTLLVGGRHVGPAGSEPIALDVSLGERWRTRTVVSPGTFERVWTIPPDAPAGAVVGAYEPLVVRTRAESTTDEYVSLEQFDAQASGVPVLVLSDGWYEPERDPRSGRMWRWMSNRAAVDVWGAGCDLELRVQGTWPRRYWRAPTLVASVAGVVVWEGRLARPFDVRMRVPSSMGASPVRVDLMSSDAFTGGDASGSGDTRRLAIEVHAVRASPADGHRACRADGRVPSPVFESDLRR